MQQNRDDVRPVEPPVDLPQIQRGNWLAVRSEDPVAEYISRTLWDRREEPTSWALARLSNAA